ncbi:MAG: metal-dependent hydrolase [Anaerolineae bacterium]
MQIPGHLAVALAQASLPPLRRGSKRLLLVLLLASLFPDMVDKTIGYIFHLMPNGRHYAHNLFSLLGSTLLVTLLAGRSTGGAWFLGYLGHLLVDTERMVPWFFPVKQYSFKKGRLHFKPAQLGREFLFLVLVLLLRRLSQAR